MSESNLSSKDRNIVARLREFGRGIDTLPERSNLVLDAAAEIERLRSALNLARNLVECPPAIRALADDALEGHVHELPPKHKGIPHEQNPKLCTDNSCWCWETETSLPCPFCGGTVDPRGWRNGLGGRGPECESCGATASSLAQWNESSVSETPARFSGERLDMLIGGLQELAGKLTDSGVYEANISHASVYATIVREAIEALTTSSAQETEARRNPFDAAAIAGWPDENRITMCFETREQYEAALLFLDMADEPSSQVKATTNRNQAEAASLGAEAVAPTPRGSLPNSLGAGGAGSHPAASSFDPGYDADGREPA